VLLSEDFSIKKFLSLLVREANKSSQFSKIFHIWLPHFEFKNLTDRQIERDYISQPLQEYVDEKCELVVKAVTEKHDRFFCCSTQGDIPSMWAHYAERYRGVVLNFYDKDNKKEGLFKEQSKILYGKENRTDWNAKMEYPPVERVYFNEKKMISWFNALIEAEINNDSSWTHENIVIPCYTTKSLHWQYEAEHRFFRFLEETHPDVGSDYYYESIPITNLKSVILGNQIDPAHEHYIKKLLKNYDSHVELRKILGLERGYTFKFSENLMTS
jgi:hypothetical protein